MKRDLIQSKDQYGREAVMDAKLNASVKAKLLHAQVSNFRTTTPK